MPTKTTKKVAPKTMRSARFSKRHLIVAMAVFGLIGGYLVYRTFATSYVDPSTGAVSAIESISAKVAKNKKSVTVTWKTDLPATSYVHLGTWNSKKQETVYKQKYGNGKFTTKHKVVIPMKGLKIYTTYYIRITSTEKDTKQTWRLPSGSFWVTQTWR